MSGSTQTTAQYSARSQRSMLDEERLRGELAEIGKLVQYTERKKAEAEQLKARYLKLAAEGGRSGHDSLTLARGLQELEDARRVLAAYDEQRKAIEARIAGLALSPAQVVERRERQNYVAQLTDERHKKDQHIDGALKAVRRLLQERRELSAKIQKSADAAEITPGADGLDAQRFDELLAALPEDLLTESNRWAGWFLGTQSAKPYVVRDRLLVLPETLASHGVYCFGERVELSDEQARELLREDRPARTNVAPWRCAPPSIMTVEAWDAAVALAKGRGVTVEDVLFWEDYDRDAKLRESFGPPYEDLQVGMYEDHGDLVTVKVLCNGNVSRGDREYHDGDTMLATDGRWNLVESVQRGSYARP